MTGSARTIRAAWVLLAAAIALGGCDGVAPPRTPYQVAQIGNSICNEFQSEVAAIPRPSGRGGAAAYFDHLVSLAKQELSRFQTINPDHRLKPEVDEFIRLSQGQITALEGAAAKAHAGDTQGAVAEVKQTTASGGRLRALARQLGWTSCTR